VDLRLFNHGCHRWFTDVADRNQMTKKGVYQKEIKKIIQQIKERYQPEKIILFGSFVYGKPKENSDVDLLVIKKTKKRLGWRLFEVAKVIDSEWGTDILVYTPQEWEERLRKKHYFFKEINEKGNLVYEKNRYR